MKHFLYFITFFLCLPLHASFLFIPHLFLCEFSKHFSSYFSPSCSLTSEIHSLFSSVFLPQTSHCTDLLPKSILCPSHSSQWPKTSMQRRKYPLWYQRQEGNIFYYSHWKRIAPLHLSWDTEMMEEKSTTQVAVALPLCQSAWGTRAFPNFLQR